MAEGSKTPDLTLASALDEVIGNQTADGIKRTRRIAIEALATQLAGTSPLSALSSAAVLYPTRAALFADLTHAEPFSGWVYGDPTAAYNGIYRYVDGSPDSWVRALDLPYSFIRAKDDGAGTANAIVATSSIPLPATAYGAIILMNVFEANTGAATVSINGAAAKPLVTNSGNALAAGYLTPGMLAAFVDAGANYRLLSDVASAAIQAAAEAAVVAAEAARDEAVNATVFNPVVKKFTSAGVGPYDMGAGNTIGSANLLDVKVGGVWQDHDKYTVSGTTFTFITGPGDGLEMEAVLRADVRVVNTPASASVDRPSLSTSLVSYLDDRYVPARPLSKAAHQPTIVLTFDEYADTTVTGSAARTSMATHNLVGTFYASPYQIPLGALVASDLVSMQASGWEIGAYSGANMVTEVASNRVLALERLRDLKNDLWGYGIVARSLAPSQRAWNSQIRNVADGLFSHVRVADNFRSTLGRWGLLPIQDKQWIADGGTASLTTADTVASLSAQVDDLIALGGLWIVVIHRVADSGDTNYRVPTTVFDGFCAKISAERNAGNLRVLRVCDL